MIFHASTQFRSLLAASTAFQTASGAIDATDALDYIHLFRSDDEDFQAQQFFAVIENDITLNLTRRATGVGPAAFARNDGCRIVFIGEYSEFSSANAIDFIQEIDAILLDLLTISSTGSFFKIDSIEQVPPLVVDKGEDPFRWSNGAIRGYHLNFIVRRSNR